MNYLLIGTCIIIVVCIIVGYAKGFIRFAVSLGATVATIILVVAVAPYVSDAIIKYTPLDNVIKEAIVKAALPDNMSAEFEVMKESLAEVEASLDNESIQAIKDAIASYQMPLQEQIATINQAKIPGFLKQGLLENNNNEVYKLLGVDNFIEYIAAYVVKLAINILSFLVAFIIITILVRAIVFSLDIVAGLPVLNGINRLAGALLGVVSAIIIIWIAFLVITILYSTQMGTLCFEYIEQSKVLTFLYDKNMILNFLTSIR